MPRHTDSAKHHSAMRKQLNTMRINHTTSSTCSPKSSRLPEPMSWILIDIIRAMLMGAGLRAVSLGEALYSATYL